MFESDIAARVATMAAARSAMQFGEVDKAEAILRSLLQVNPDDMEAASLLASVSAKGMRQGYSPAAPSSGSNGDHQLGLWGQMALLTLIGFATLCASAAELRLSLPLLLTNGPDAIYMYPDKTGNMSSEPASVAVAGGFIFMAISILCFGFILTLWKKSRRKQR